MIHALIQESRNLEFLLHLDRQQKLGLTISFALWLTHRVAPRFSLQLLSQFLRKHELKADVIEDSLTFLLQQEIRISVFS